MGLFSPHFFRPYQVEAVYSIARYFERANGNPLCLMPTATGKSYVIAGFTCWAFDCYAFSRVMILANDEKLLTQNREKLMTMWPTAPAGIYSAGLRRYDTHCPITFAGIQSVYDRAAEFGHVDLLLVDEAHGVGPNENTQYRRFIFELLARNPRMKVVGFTATGYRVGLGPLTDPAGGVFTDVCCDMTTPEWFQYFLAMGYISPLVVPETYYRLEIGDVRISGDDFNQGDLQEQVNQDHKTQACVREMCWLGRDRKRWLVFAVGVEHADRCAWMMNREGISTVVIHSKLNDSEYDENFLKFKAGKVQAAVNMNGMTTGVDIPELDFGAILRHTMSPVLWVQILGRFLRVAPWAQKINSLIADFTDNSVRLGPIDYPLVPQRKAPRIGKSSRYKKPSEKRVKTCGYCRHQMAPHLRACPACGYIFAAERIEERAAGVELIRGVDGSASAQDEPVVELIDVHNVVLRGSRQTNATRVLIVGYGCGVQGKFEEIVCLEHPGNARFKAENWWKDRAKAQPGEQIIVPKTVAEALNQEHRLKIPRQIRVWINNKPKPKVLGHVY